MKYSPFLRERCKNAIDKLSTKKFSNYVSNGHPDFRHERNAFSRRR